jgi:hypothetical protein
MSVCSISRDKLAICTINRWVAGGSIADIKRTLCPIWLRVSLALVFALPLASRAEESDVRALRQQVDELKDTVRLLRDRVKLLEDAKSARIDGAAPTAAMQERGALQASVSAAPDIATPKVPDHADAVERGSIDDKIVMLRNRWRNLGLNQTQDDVRNLLGAPTKEMLINGKTVWYYHYAGWGAGSVFFRGDGRVSSSQPPNVGWGN